jgi:hypothetical protein
MELVERKEEVRLETFVFSWVTLAFSCDADEVSCETLAFSCDADEVSCETLAFTCVN